MDLLTNLGGPVGGIVLTFIVTKYLGFVKARKLADQALGLITYAKNNLVELNDLALAARDALADDKVDSKELQRLVKEMGDLAQTLRNRTVLTDGQAAMQKLAPKK